MSDGGKIKPQAYCITSTMAGGVKIKPQAYCSLSTMAGGGKIKPQAHCITKYYGWWRQDKTTSILHH